MSTQSEERWVSRPSSIEGDKEWQQAELQNEDNRATASGTNSESERPHGIRDDRWQDNGGIGDDGFRPTQPSGWKEEEEPLWFLQIGPINLTRGRFKWQTYGGSDQIMRREGPDGVSRYVAYLQDVKKGVSSSGRIVFAEYCRTGTDS